MRRTVIYSAPSEGFAAIEVDPEGRFLLMQSFASGNVYSLDLMDPDADPTLEFSAAQFPQLTETQIIVARDHLTQGRVYEFSEGNKHIGLVPLDAKYTYAFDIDNDGVFDGIEVMDTQEYMESPYFDAAAYVSMFSLR